MDKDIRKPYAPPSVTDLGSARTKTKGLWGECWEVYGRVYYDISPPPDDDEPPPGGN